MSASADGCELSIVLGAYNMHRELPRTLHTLSRKYQQCAADLNYEVIVADNGSERPVDVTALASGDLPVRQMEFAAGDSSPVKALNHALRASRGEWIGLMIDGARMLSPGVFKYAMAGGRMQAKAVICTHGFHLGPDVQSRSAAAGYGQRVEDELLDEIDWKRDGYRLFEISVFAGSSFRGWFVNPTESNCLILNRRMWEALGHLDERFATPGGGLANLDLFKRACETPGAQLITLLGEGNFHQIHGGAATGKVRPTGNPNEAFDREYQQIRGEVYRVPTYRSTFIGSLHPSARRQVLQSAKLLQEFAEPDCR